MWIAKAICKALQQLKQELAVNFALFVVQPVSVVKFKVGIIIYAVENKNVKSPLEFLEWHHHWSDKDEGVFNTILKFI